MLRNCIFFLLLLPFTLCAQITVTFVIKEAKAQFPNSQVFVAGSFNGWNPTATPLTKTGNQNKIILSVPKGIIEYKFTLGSWEKVEVDKAGADVPNRSAKLDRDTTIFIEIGGWKNAGPSVKKKSTRSPQVRIMDSAFTVSSLNTTRRIWVYLPKNYLKEKTKRYPVIYMHDGQNLFDASTSAFGEWGIDESLDTLPKKHREAIIVGIDNGPERIQEYNPYDNEKFGKGKGDAYLEFLVRELIPYINKKYRTATERSNTIIAGSSMGGLISYYAMLKYPDVFGKAGIFSPAFWVADPSLDSFTNNYATNLKGKMFFYMGGKEGEKYVEDMMKMETAIAKKTSILIASMVDPESEHNEAAWRKWFPFFYHWIMRDDLNYVIPHK